MEKIRQKRAGKGIRKSECSKCKKIKESDSKRYCNSCTAAYNREWRKTHPQSEEQKIKANIRRKTTMRVARGLLKKYPCEVCDNPKVEAHHDDYNQPYCIRWLCKKCHDDWHKNQRGKGYDHTGSEA